MIYRRMLKWLVFLAGVVLAGAGAIVLVAAANGAVSQGLAPVVVMGTSMLVVAMPALVLPFSVRAAKILLAVALAGFAVVALWLAFWPRAGIVPSLQVRIAIVAFAALLVVRLLMSWRRWRGSGMRGRG